MRPYESTTGVGLGQAVAYLLAKAEYPELGDADAERVARAAIRQGDAVPSSFDDFIWKVRDAYMEMP